MHKCVTMFQNKIDKYLGGAGYTQIVDLSISQRLPCPLTIFSLLCGQNTRITYRTWNHHLRNGRENYTWCHVSVLLTLIPRSNRTSWWRTSTISSTRLAHSTGTYIFSAIVKHRELLRMAASCMVVLKFVNRVYCFFKRPLTCSKNTVVNVMPRVRSTNRGYITQKLKINDKSSWVFKRC